MQPVPGRTCPLSYRYAPGAFSGASALRADTLWVAGGLYGNTYALEALLEAFAAEPGDKALVFNGDFHWFDVAPSDFSLIDAAALAVHAIRGNVETEIADPGKQLGCGCAYPAWVDEATVERSNRIIERLRATARSTTRDLRLLAALPMHLTAQVGEERVGIVHGDAESLAGWNFSQEVLSTAGGRAQAEADFARCGVSIFASSHTCLPVLRQFSHGRILVNNGAAGMPNFRGEHYGIATRISVRESERALYRARCGNTFVEAMPLRYDVAAWEQRFLAQWPPGSDAHRSYFERIAGGPGYTLREAA
jgi:hypothetical protein